MHFINAKAILSAKNGMNIYRGCTHGCRYEVLKELQKRGIPTVVWLCPILPYINDTEGLIK